ncbi:hypothetical protein PsorP6_015654 [Peronosclerospora sorghi]|uniref:Uncharacterized protein n=1 Tax=Peronosclerospora sorghi TaxID=230839 RepID=A0ACC0WN33_9STRA|nr:hypothetical protein PsorP6_015654 [Peronosclerospora sorghi]
MTNESGKENALEVEVKLVEFNKQGEPDRSNDKDFIDIPLRILLFFESESAWTTRIKRSFDL